MHASHNIIGLYNNKGQLLYYCKAVGLHCFIKFISIFNYCVYNICYSFDPPIEVKPGDSIETICAFNTMSRNSITYQGEATSVSTVLYPIPVKVWYAMGVYKHLKVYRCTCILGCKENK